MPWLPSRLRSRCLAGSLRINLMFSLLLLAGCGSITLPTALPPQPDQAAAPPTPTQPLSTTPVPTQVGAPANILTLAPAALIQQHVPDTQAVTYPTNPPVGGPHWAAPAQWGAYPADPPPDERLVHNMEHGGVIIWFDPTLIKGADYERLFALYQQLAGLNYRTMLTAHTGMETPLAVTAWGALLRLDTVDEAQIEQFYMAYILQGPECVDQQCPY